MTTREEAQNKWAQNFSARVSIMAERMGDEEAYAEGVANYLGVSVSEIEDSESGSVILNNFEEFGDLSADEIRSRVQEEVPGAASFSDAVEELAQKWDNNYAAAYTG